MDSEVDLALQDGTGAYDNPTQVKRALACMNNFRSLGLLCDVTLVVIGDERSVKVAAIDGVNATGTLAGLYDSSITEIPCHKLVLAASSPYFHAMFTNSGFPEAHSNRVTLYQMQGDAVRAAVDYMYTGRCSVTESNAFSLLTVCSMMQLDELHAACCEFLKSNMSVVNCLVAFRFSELHLCSELHDCALRFIAANFSTLCTDSLFAEVLSIDAFCTLLRNDRLAVSDEDQVLDAAVRWLSFSSEPQRRAPEVVRRVLEHVRMPLLRSETLVRLAQDDAWSFIRDADTERRWLIEALAFHLHRNRCAGNVDDRAEQVATTSKLPPSTSRCDSDSDFELQAQSMRSTDRSTAASPTSGPLHRARSSDTDGRASACSGDLNMACECDERLEAEGETASCVNVDTDSRNFHGNTSSSVRFRARCASNVSASQMLVLVGGHSGEAMRNVEAYSFRSARWQNLAALPSRRGRHGAAFAAGNLYVVGGFSGSQRVRACDRFDLRTREWHPAPILNTRRCTLGCCVRGDSLFAVGGFNGHIGLATVEMLALNGAAEWRYVSPMSTRRSSVGVTTVRRIDELVAAVGGYDGAGRQFLQTAELYDPHRDVWSVTSPMTSRRCGAATSGDDWTVYAIGGQDGPLVKNTVERFDVREGDWKLVAPMRFCRRNAAAVVNDADGCVYVCGGDDGRVHTDTVEVYDPRADAWSMLDSRMQFERSFAAAAIVSI